MESYSLFELNEYFRRVVALNFQDALWIRCEISQVNNSRGHYYLNLIEKSAEEEKIVAQSSAIIWAGKYRELRRKFKKTLDELLQNGTAVLLQVRVDFDERYGLKLIIEDIDPSYTMGQMELKRQEILAALLKKGLLDVNSQIDLPPVIQKLAIISSPTAAGLQDYLNQMATNAYGYQFSNQIFPAAMQGVNVEKEVLQQLKKIARLKENYDAVIIIRGGGSKLDLAAFDNFELGKAVAKFPIPVFIGIGHEIDETILDRVAHTSLKTPTAVADYLINRVLHFESTILEHKNYIRSTINYLVQEEKGQLSYVKKMVKLQANTQLRESAVLVAQFKQRLPLSTKNQLITAKNQLNQLEKVCQLLAPETALKRGFSITTANGKVVTDKAQVKKGDLLQTQLLEGIIKSTVN